MGSMDERDDAQGLLGYAWPKLAAWMRQQVVELVLWGSVTGRGEVVAVRSPAEGGHRGPGGLRVILALEHDHGGAVREAFGRDGLRSVLCGGPEVQR